MPRPKTKTELLDAGNIMYAKLNKLIESTDYEIQTRTFCFEDRDRNLGDILTHLYEWHLLLENWILSNKKGEKRAFLPEGYNWKTYPKLNLVFWEKHQQTSLEESMSLLESSHKSVMSLLDDFSDEELFTKKYYNWTGSTSLGSYCVSATSSHYDWAIKKYKKHIKLLME